MTLSEEFYALRALLRKVAKGYPGKMPAELQEWWALEQSAIDLDQQIADAKKAQRITDITNQIAELQAKLAAIQ